MKVEENGVFCLAWQVKGEVHSIWANSSVQIFNLYFKMRNKLNNAEVWYFPTCENLIKVFGGKNEVLD